MKIIIYNNICEIECEKEKKELAERFLDKYATGYEESREYIGGHSKVVKNPVALYLTLEDKDKIRYILPRGLWDLIKEEERKRISLPIEDKSTDNYKLEELTIQNFRERLKSILQPESGFDLRDDQVTAIFKALKIKRGLIQYPTGCLLGDSKIIMTGDVIKSISEMEKKKEKYIGKRVYSVTKEGYLEFGEIEDIILSGYVSELIKIEFEGVDNTPVICTENHPFLIGNDIYREAGKLRKRDLVYSIKFSDLLNLRDENNNPIREVRREVKKIKSVRRIKLENSEPVYDLTIKNFNNFSVMINDREGVVVHNSGKTEIISGIIKSLVNKYPDIKLLVLEPTDLLVNNTSARFQRYKIDSVPYKTTRQKIENNVIVSHPMGLLNDLNKNPDLLKCINGVFWDECLEGSTKILLPNNTQISIEDLYYREDIDEVLSYNLNTKIIESKKILRRIKTEHKSGFLVINYKNPDFEEIEQIRVTGNHKIYTYLGYRKAEDLELGDLLKIVVNRNNKITSVFTTIESIEEDNRIYDYRYNLEIEDNHNYLANNILVSNCHHIKSNTWSLLNVCIPNAEYALGFSALAITKEHRNETSLKVLDIDEVLALGAVSRLLCETTPRYYINRGILATPVVIQFKAWLVKTSMTNNNWQVLKKTILESYERINIGLKAIEVLIKYNRRCLILVDTKVQAYKIMNQLADTFNLSDRAGVAFGGNIGLKLNLDKYKSKRINPEEIESMKNQKKKLEVRKKQLAITESCLYNIDNITDRFDRNEFNILIATTVADEGLDLDSLDAVLLISAGRKDRRFIQRVGRAIRKSKTGKFGYVLDLNDSGNNVLEYHSKERMRIYREIIEAYDECIYENFDVNQFEYLFKKLEGIED